MTCRFCHVALLPLLSIGVAFASAPGFAQAPPQGTPAQVQDDPNYTPPLRGAPARTVGGASRGAVRPAAPLPAVQLLAPADHAGETASATPTLCYFVSRRVASPMQLTIRAPLQPKPVLEVTIPSAPGPGIYALRLGDYRSRLEPGIAYTWSVSVILDPRSWSRNIVASAVILRTPQGGEVGSGATAPGLARAAELARAGLWYDAIAAAFDGRGADGGHALGRLMTQVGLTGAMRAETAGAATTAGR